MTVDRRTLLQFAGAITAGSVAGPAVVGVRHAWSAENAEQFPDEVMNPVEVHGRDAIPVIGKLPGTQRMYVLRDGEGQFHRLGSMVMTRVARPQETAGTYELSTFAGPTGSAMPLHAHLFSHVALVVMGGDVEVELAGQTWRMLKGDFANIPPGTPFGWTMRSDRGRVALFTMGGLVGRAFVAMGAPAASAALPQTASPISPDALVKASLAGDFQLRQSSGPAGEAVRVTNMVLPTTPGHYVIADGGGERYGGNTFCAKNINTSGQFLFIMTEGGPSPGTNAHFHARHTEDFFGLDGETACWAYGQNVPLRAGDFLQAPPRHLHGFKMQKSYNRFVGFLTPGIFEKFFMRPNGSGGRPLTPGADAPPYQGAPKPPGPPGSDPYRLVSMSARGPDGYPLDVHKATLPLPPQDPFWTQLQRVSSNDQRLALLQHANVLCGGGPLGSVPLSAELKRALSLKPRAELFI